MLAQVKTEKDRHYFDALYRAWQEFSVIKDQNANWMLEGKYDNAKQALITKGRTCFKKAMDLVTEWMEEE
ncbi:hypothetical protein D3C86_2120360 [compost metagenome]